jgi:hypothetical protein
MKDNFDDYVGDGWGRHLVRLSGLAVLVVGYWVGVAWLIVSTLAMTYGRFPSYGYGHHEITGTLLRGAVVVYALIVLLTLVRFRWHPTPCCGTTDHA